MKKYFEKYIFPALWLTMLYFMFLLGYLVATGEWIDYVENINYPVPHHKTATTTPEKSAENKTVIASWYDYEINGIEWSKDHHTCASRDYPRKTMLRVTSTATGKSVDCLVNDYGPEERTGRDIDLSSYSFSSLAPLKWGLIRVTIKKL